MAVKLIAENLLDDDDFDSATEQEGEYWDQPEADGGNSGDLKPVVDGTPTSFSYSGTTDSAGDTTSVICSALSAFGDNYFIGGTVTITESGHGAEDEEKAVTDFDQATGDLTTNAFSASIGSGVDFDLEIAFSTRDIRVELTASGDTGDAEFKWSHDGGTTYLGRDDPNQADWLAEQQILSTAHPSVYPAGLAQLANGDWIIGYEVDAAEDYTAVKKSSDRGLTWGSEITVATYSETSGHGAMCILVLSSGRIWLYPYASTYAAYSDDNGDTWTVVANTNPSGCNAIIEMPSGKLIGFDALGSSGIDKYESNDGGFTWGTATNIHNPAGNQNYLDAKLLSNGDIVIVYETDEDSEDTNYEIKSVKSSDGGATWGTARDVMDYETASNILQRPTLCEDINGDLYCAAEGRVTGGDDYIVYARSDDKADSWGSDTILKSVSGHDLREAELTLLDGHIMACLYNDMTDDDLDMVRRGMWEAYSANGCPCATQGTGQKLVCDAELTWYGESGDSGDKWTIEPGYYYGMENIITDSPSHAWRSTQDNIDCNLKLDAGSGDRFLVTGAAFFGCNVKDLNFQANQTDVWSSPTRDVNIDFEVVTGEVDNVYDNYIRDTSLFSSYYDHYFAGGNFYLRMTSGTDNGVTWKIVDNAGYYCRVDDGGSNNVAATDTFSIYQSHAASNITSVLRRFMRIVISAQHTADNYYQIGSMVVGDVITLSDAWSVGYSKPHLYDIKVHRTPQGGIIPIKGAGRKRRFDLTWRASEDGRQEMLALLDYIEGKNIALIPDDSDMLDCYLVKLVSPAEQRQRVGDYWDLSIILEEVL